MADTQLDIKDLAQDIQELLKDNSELDKQFSKSIQNRLTGVKNLVKQMQKGVQLSARQVGFVTGTLKSLQSEVSLLSEANDLRNEAFDLMKGTKVLRKDELNYANKILSTLEDEAISAADKLNATRETLKYLNSAIDLHEREAEVLSEYTDKLDEVKSSWKKIAMHLDVLSKSTRLMAIAAVGILVKKLFAAKDALMGMSKNLGLNATQTAKMSANVGSAAAKMTLYNIDAQEAASAAEAIVNATGDNNRATVESISNIAKYAKTSGVAASEVAEVYTSLQRIPGVTDEIAGDTLDFARNMSVAANVPLNKVMSSISSNAEIFSTTSLQGAKNMMKAAVYATKLGLEFKTITDTAAGLLDFESSIEAEMQASALIGRQLNLDAARRAAYAKDYVGLTNEILKNVGSAAEWEKLSIPQQEALAGAMNMQVSDISKLIKAKEDGVKLDNAALENMGLQNNAANDINAAVKESTGLLNAENILLGLILLKMIGIKGVMAGLNKVKGWFSGSATTAAADTAKEGAENVAGDKINDVAEDKISKLGETGGGAGGGLKGLANGLSAMGNAKVLFGAFNLIPASIGLVVLLPALPVLALLAIPGFGAGISMGLSGLGTGLAALGNPQTLFGAAVLIVAAAALIPAAFAFSLLKDVPVENIIAFSLAIPLLGLAFAGLGFLSPLIALAAISVAMMGGSLLVMGYALQSADFSTFTQLSTSMSELISNVGGIYLLAGAFSTLALSITGLAASLFVLAPMLPVLAMAESIGISQSGTNGEKSAGIIEKLDELIEIVRQGGTVELDGNKVGNYVVKFIQINEGSRSAGRKLL